MANKLSFIVLGDSGTKIKQIHISRKQLVALCGLLLFSVAAVGYGLYDYINLQSSLEDRSGLERRLAIQSEEVLHQRQQIQRFAQEIDDLKIKIVELNEFGDKIRIIANIDQPGGQDGLFGMGGAAPEDLNSAIELDRGHRKLIKEMHQQMGQLDDASAHQQTAFTHLLNKLEERKNLLAHTPAIRPAKGWMTSLFGYRHSPFTGKREFHKGIDIANRKGTAIMATADGIVSYSGKKGPLGKVLIIDHGYGLITRYGHIDKYLKKQGENVQRGEVVALMGNTGRSTGSHLHYEVRLNGLPVNPSKYILN